MKWTIIRNPRAASGKGERAWPDVAQQLAAAGIEFEDQVTQHEGHAIELARQAVLGGARQILAVGGDGTAHEVANGILDQDAVKSLDVTLAQIPIGTGNDWGRTMGIPSKIPAVIAALTNGEERIQDVGRVDFDQSGAHRYFINVGGMGYDGLVTEVANERKARGKGGIMGYVGALLGSLVRYESVDMSLQTEEGEIIQDKIFSLSVGIGNYNGGGMKQCPKALTDDGLLDITVIGDISKWTVLRNVPNLFSGKFVRNPAVSLLRSRLLHVTADAENPIELDGESIGKGSCVFSCEPKRLRVRVQASK